MHIQKYFLFIKKIHSSFNFLQLGMTIVTGNGSEAVEIERSFWTASMAVWKNAESVTGNHCTRIIWLIIAVWTNVCVISKIWVMPLRLESYKDRFLTIPCPHFLACCALQHLYMLCLRYCHTFTEGVSQSKQFPLLVCNIFWYEWLESFPTFSQYNTHISLLSFLSCKRLIFVKCFP